MPFPFRVRRAAPAFALLLLAGCATHQPGWRGKDAAPFDGARASCEAEAESAAANGRDADQAMDRCMARHGWHRDSDAG